MTTEKTFESNLNILDRINVAHCAAERARMYVTDTERFNGEFQTVRMWRSYNCFISNYGSYVENLWCLSYLFTKHLLITTVSQLQQLWKTCSFYIKQIATTLINGVQAFVQHLLNWLMANQSLLMKMTSAVILIGLTPNGNSLTSLITT